MPIKQIQLRGISRNPSDRMTQDGGCAESLNVHLDNLELAPTMEADDITSTLDLPSTGAKPVVFIHKAGADTIYIAMLVTNAPGEAGAHYFTFYYVNPDAGDTEWTQMLRVTFLGQLKYTIRTVGNTLVISYPKGRSDHGQHYFLYKEGAYINLGQKIPVPEVTFTTTPDEVEPFTTDENLAEIPSIITADAYESSFQKALDLYGVDADSTGFINEFTGRVYDILQRKMVLKRNAGRFCKPVLAKVALRLFDGTYYDFMAPCLLTGNGTNTWFEGRDKGQTAPLTAYAVGQYVLTNCFTVIVGIANAGALEDWSDIVKSVDVFITQDISTPNTGASPVSIGAISGSSYYDHKFKGAESEKATDDFERDMLAASVFYLLKSIDVKDAQVATDLKPISQDELLLKRTLPMGDSNTYSAMGEMMSYNNRLIIAGAYVELPAANPEFNCVLEDDGPLPEESYFIRTIFHIKDENGAGRTVKGFEQVSGSYYSKLNSLAFIAYPNPNCYRVDIYRYETVEDVENDTPLDILHYDMKEHPSLNVSYFFAGLDKYLVDEGTATEQETITGSRAFPREDKEYEMRNKLYMSLPDNPFMFGFEGRVAFTGEVISLAVVTKALSQGQFGQFPLYVFTSDGIWAVTINAEGGFDSAHPVSRDVALKGTICPLDQAVAFVTAKGVMMLTGSDILGISPNMTGRHYVLEDDVKVALQEDENWSALSAIPASSESFMDFMEDCYGIYDYYGDRVIFFRKSSFNARYAYVYHLASQTWHKMSLPGTGDPVVLNSYPEAYVSIGNSVYNFTTTKSNLLDTVSYKGIIITRAFDLGEPDVRKTIKSIRIRGDFDAGDVKYILLGSMDGHVFGMLHSLRGGSYKQYRLVLLADLSANERISWVDVEYETRFSLKLR